MLRESRQQNLQKDQKIKELKEELMEKNVQSQTLMQENKLLLSRNHKIMQNSQKIEHLLPQEDVRRASIASGVMTVQLDEDSSKKSSGRYD